MSLTIKQIAELANTSRGTVDRVINNRGGVNRETEERIIEIIKKHEYKYNQYARALVKSKRIYKIGVIITAYNSDFYTRVLKGIRTAALKEKNRQLQLIIKVTNYSAENQVKAINELLEDEISGLILNPIYDETVKDRLETLLIPIVTISNDLEIGKELAFVGCDYYSNGLVARDLFETIKDRNEVLIISGSSHPKASEKRIKGFIENISSEIKVNYIYTHDTDKDTYNEVFAYFSKHPISPVYFSTGNGIGGAIKAFEVLNLSPKIIAVDEHPDVIKGLHEGKIAVTVTQQPEKQGMASLDIMRKYLILKEEPVTRHFKIGNKIKVKHSNFNETIIEEKNDNMMS